jgi:hypothetical protein
MAVVVLVVMLLEGRGIGYDGWWLRGLLYDVCSLLRTLRVLVVCAGYSRSARRGATAVSLYDTGWDSIVVVVFLDADETHDDLDKENANGTRIKER